MYGCIMAALLLLAGTVQPPWLFGNYCGVAPAVLPTTHSTLGEAVVEYLCDLVQQLVLLTYME